MNTAITSPGPDFTAIRQRQQATWASGDYAAVGTTLQIVGETLAEAADIRAGQAVLDVAAGNGNASLAAARRGALVTSTDYMQALLDKGRARAQAEELAVQFRLADAEALPLEDGSFDTVLSTFGVMFTPDQQRAAHELARVCKPGGKIGLANWTPTGFIGELFKVIGRHLPPPAGVKPASLWGTEERLRELFGERSASLQTQREHFVFRYRTPQHWLDTFRTYYGPLQKAFAALGAEQQEALAAELIGLVQRFNRADDGAMVVPSEYLVVVIRR